MAHIAFLECLSQARESVVLNASILMDSVPANRVSIVNNTLNNHSITRRFANIRVLIATIAKPCTQCVRLNRQFLIFSFDKIFERNLIAESYTVLRVGNIIFHHPLGFDYIKSVLMPVKDRPLVVFVAVNVCAVREMASHIKLALRRYSQHLYKLAFWTDNFITNLQIAVILPAVSRKNWCIITQSLTHASRKTDPQEIYPLIKQVLQVICQHFQHSASWLIELLLRRTIPFKVNAIAVEHILCFKQVRPADNVIDLRHVLACFHLAHHGCTDRAQLTRVFVGIEPLVLRQSVPQIHDRLKPVLVDLCFCRILLCIRFDAVDDGNALFWLHKKK